MLSLRRAAAEDARLLWEWANDPVVRASAFSTDPIPWENHLRWLSRKLSDPGCLLLIGVNDEGDPVGQIRFDTTSEGEAEIDVSVAPDRRGHGWGSQLITSGVSYAWANSPLQAVHAIIKEHNAASIAAFRRAGFDEIGPEVIHEVPCLHFVKRRNPLPHVP